MAENLGLHKKPETTPERAQFYAKLDPLSLAPLWDRLSDIVTREPHVRAKPISGNTMPTCGPCSCPPPV